MGITARKAHLGTIWNFVKKIDQRRKMNTIPVEITTCIIQYCFDLEDFGEFFSTIPRVCKSFYAATSEKNQYLWRWLYYVHYLRTKQALGNHEEEEEAEQQKIIWKQAFTSKSRIEKRWLDGKYKRNMSLEGHVGRITCCKIWMDNASKMPQVWSGGYDGYLILWDLRTGKWKLRIYLEHAILDFKRIKFKAGDSDELVDAIIVVTGEKHSFLKVATSGLFEVVTSTVGIYELESGMLLKQFADVEETIHCCEYTRDCILLATVSELCCYDLKSTNLVWKSDIPNIVVMKKTQLKDQEAIVAATLQSTICLIDPLTGKIIKLLDNTTPMRCLDVCPYRAKTNSQLIVTGNSDGTTNVFNLASNDSKVLMKHNKAVNCVAVSRDGKRIVTGSLDCTLKVWELTKSGWNNVHKLYGILLYI